MAWEILRELFESNGIKGGSFVRYLVANVSTAAKEEAIGNDNDNVDDELYAKYANNTTTRSYEYYEAAAEEKVPSYKVEPAKSGRSKCSKCKEMIDKLGLRVGWHDKLIGAYRVRILFSFGANGGEKYKASLICFFFIKGVESS